jgi:hypothetical protein
VVALADPLVRAISAVLFPSKASSIDHFVIVEIELVSGNPVCENACGTGSTFMLDKP